MTEAEQAVLRERVQRETNRLNEVYVRLREAEKAYDTRIREAQEAIGSFWNSEWPTISRRSRSLLPEMQRAVYEAAMAGHAIVTNFGLFRDEVSRVPWAASAGLGKLPDGTPPPTVDPTHLRGVLANQVK